MGNQILKDIETIATNQARNIVLDYAKGFAIILIVIYHTYGYCGQNVGSIVNSFCYTVQIPIFIYVSGLLSGKHQSQNINIKKKAIRLLVPFLFFYIIWCIININNLYDFIQDEFKGGYWFTLVLFEMMVMLSLSNYLSDKHNINVTYMQIVIFIILSLYVFFTPKGNIINTLLSINLLWHYSPFFYLGIYSYKLETFLKKKHIIIYGSIFLLSQYLFFFYDNRLLTPVCNLFSLLFFITLFNNGIRLFENTISYIGKYSLQIYLIHFFVLHYFAKYIPLLSSRFVEFFLYIVFSFVTIFFIIGLSKIVMRYKWVRLVCFGIK